MCADLGHALVCAGGASTDPGAARDAGTWTRVACRGDGGCAHRGGADDCDDTVAAEGEACPGDPPVDYACTPDGTRALACAAGRFALWRACRGPEGCLVGDVRNIRCDTSLGQESDPCGQSGTYACSEDHKTMLVCDAGALSAATSCSGPAGCAVERETHKVSCDDSVAAEGEPCDEARRITCSMDHKSELVCSGGRYAKKRDCRRTDCRLDGAELFCD